MNFFEAGDGSFPCVLSDCPTCVHARVSVFGDPGSESGARVRPFCSLHKIKIPVVADSGDQLETLVGKWLSQEGGIENGKSRFARETGMV